MSDHPFHSGQQAVAAANGQANRASALIADEPSPAQTDGDELAAAHDKIDNLQKALVTARRIGAAIGILMHAHRLTEDQAFGLLSVTSMNSSRKLRDVADEVVLTGTLPEA